MIKVAIVDDHGIVRNSLMHLINSFEGISVVLGAENGKDLFQQLVNTRVDIVLLDLQMPVLDGYQTCEILHREYPEIKILVLSHLNSISNIRRVMKSGAHGYFTKNSEINELKEAILKLNTTGFFFEKKLESIIQEINVTPDHHDEKTLTISEREIEIIKMVARGFNVKTIGQALFISDRTVETHKRNLMERINSKNFISVIFYAVTHEIISFKDLDIND